MEFSHHTIHFLANKHHVRMLMVGGGAVHFYGYQRHSADVDFCIETTEENFKGLILVFQEMGYEIEELPEKVKNRLQNISIKFTPIDLNLDLITNFQSLNLFSRLMIMLKKLLLIKKICCFAGEYSLEDLITSKVRSGRPIDLLDVQELKRIRKI